MKNLLERFLQNEGKYWFPEEVNRTAEQGNMLNSICGPTIASAATIVVTHQMHHVTGTAAIVTITPPFPGFQGWITLIADGIWTWTAAGNIFVLGTVTAGNGRAMRFFFDGNKWYPQAVA